MSGYTEAEIEAQQKFFDVLKAELAGRERKQKEALKKHQFMMVMKSKPGSALLARGKAISADKHIWPGPKSIKPKTRKGRKRG